MGLEEFRDLWESGEYVLVRVPGGCGPGLMPIHLESGSMEIIDDDALYPAVIDRMLKAGVQVQDITPS